MEDVELRYDNIYDKDLLLLGEKKRKGCCGWLLSFFK